MTSRPYQVLLVFSDRENLCRTANFLRLFGYEVRSTADVAAALAAAEAEPVDILLVDRQFAQSSGSQLCRGIRRQGAGQYTYAIAVADGLEVASLTEGLEAGFDDFLSAPLVHGELLARLRAAARVIEFERRLHLQEGLDPVTGLAGELELEPVVMERLESAPPHDHDPLAWLAVIEIDFFPRFARQQGLAVADEVLRLAAERISAQATEGELVTTLGGGKCAVLLPASLEEQAIAWGETLLAQFQQPLLSEKEPLALTLSIGLAPLLVGGSLAGLRSQAELALNHAQMKGHNRLVSYREYAADNQQWTELAAAGKLFETTLAGDVMTPCAALLQVDDTLEQAQALLEVTHLPAVAVIDREGSFVGIITEELLAMHRSRSERVRSSSSTRLVRHVLSRDVAKFQESSPLTQVMEFFANEPIPLAVVLREDFPTGIIYCQSLAALTEKLSTDLFRACVTETVRSSAFLLVADGEE